MNLSDTLKGFFKRLNQGVDAITENRATTGNEFVENFDGLRAIAALMVFSLHVSIPYFVLGPAGVWLFFTLSGYLLYSGFLKFEDGARISTITAYLVRRVFRIMPLFAVFVVVYAYFFRTWDNEFKLSWTLAHLFFISADMHIWTVKTEMIFYLFLPFMVLSLHPVKSPLLRLVMLILMALGGWYLLEVKQLVRFHGGWPYLAPFVLGMAAVHLKDHVGPRLSRVLVVISLLTIGIFSSDFQWTMGIQKRFGLHHLSQLWGFGYLFYLPCAALVLGVAKIKSPIWGNRWLRVIGVCGYGFYLWHLPFIHLFRSWELPTPIFEIISFTTTLIVSIATYLLVEKPGIGIGRRISRWVRADHRQYRIFHPVWLCASLVVMFFGIRHAYMSNADIEFELEIWASKSAETQIFLDNGKGFREHRSGIASIRSHEWQVVPIHVNQVKIRKLRLDPGNTSGEYRLRKISVRFPLQNYTRELDLSKFSVQSGIERLSQIGDYLSIVVEPGQKDPILSYDAKLDQPRHTKKDFLIGLSFLSALFFYLACLFSSRWMNWYSIVKRRRFVL